MQALIKKLVAADYVDKHKITISKDLEPKKLICLKRHLRQRISLKLG
jgi:hypothetical protein